MAVLVGKKAPHISASAVINGEEIVENFSLDQYLGKKHVVLFFYPKDFTFVCPTELHAFQAKLKEIKMLEMILEDSKRRYNKLNDSYQTESIFTSFYNWLCYQITYSFLD